MNTTLLMLISSLIFLFILIRTFLFLVQVEGWSMSPTYRPGDRLIALRYWPQRWLRRGQIVVWKMSPQLLMASMPEAMGSKHYIKRIIGLPGDKVTAPVLHLPDPLEGEMLLAEAKQEVKSWRIPSGYCFVKGDSPGFDSTFVGPIPLGTLRGLILARLPRGTRSLEEPEVIISSRFSHSSQKER